MDMRPVMGGPQLDIRISQTTINQRGGGYVPNTRPFPKDIAQTVIPMDDGWPSLGVHHHDHHRRSAVQAFCWSSIRNPPSRIYKLMAHGSTV